MVPILRDVPEAFESPRLLIRAPRPGDGAELNAAVLETFDPLHVWMEWAKERPSVEESEVYVREAAASYARRTEFALLLFLKGTETLVGASGLGVKNWEVPAFEIGYWCRRRFEGQGYISEAVRAITTFSFETLEARRVEIRCDAHNERSRRVAERAGFHLEGELRNLALDNAGVPRNVLVFSLIPDEYGGVKAAWSE
jgi:RimJ/RimL family protein N-acetyltransferase